MREAFYLFLMKDARSKLDELNLSFSVAEER